MSRPGSMRFVMPQVAAWVDELRRSFGAELIDDALRGQRFVAVERGADGQVREVRRNDGAAPAMVVTRRAWGYRA